MAKRLPPLHRPIAIIALCFGLVIILGLVVISPLALDVFSGYRLNWPELSNIGQTYGAVSALLSSLALFGVIVSLLFQARDSRAAHEQVTRTFHFDLLKMAMDDPALMTAVGAPWGLPIPRESQRIRQHLYIQMWVSFLVGNYVIGESSESLVRYVAAHELFRSEAGRSYWEAIGRVELGLNRGRRRRFYSILDEEYTKVLAEGVPVSPPVESSRPSASARTMKTQRRRRLCQMGITAATVAGLLARCFWRHRRSINLISHA